jgi:hypothetical protein
MTRTPVWRRYSRLCGPDPAADVKDELRFHVEAKIDDLVREGWGPEAARARRRGLSRWLPTCTESFSLRSTDCPAESVMANSSFLRTTSAIKE